jgi:putative membrane protein
MVLQSLAGLPAFLIYFCVSAVLIAAYVYVYTWLTPHDEFELIRNNVPGAAVALGLSTIGFALPLTSSISHSDGVIDLTIWGIIALVVQIVIYYLARIPIPDMSERIAKGEMGPAIWLGLASITGGLINAASMST